MCSCRLLPQQNIFCVIVQRNHRIFLPCAEGTKIATEKKIQARTFNFAMALNKMILRATGRRSLI